MDLENKPGTYGPGDWTHPKVTALGAMWLHKRKATGWILDRTDAEQMTACAEAFRLLWDRADFIIGHNVRRHDRKILDGLYTALGLPLLRERRMVDTYLDQPRMQGLSRSLENLAERWGCPVKKMHLSEHDWERAYDGDPEAQMLMKRRVESDCQINAWLYGELVRRELLRW